MSRSDRIRSRETGLEPAGFPRSNPELERDHGILAKPAARDTDRRPQAKDGHKTERGFEREPGRCLTLPEVKTLRDIGMFRALAFEDVARHRYGHDYAETTNHLQALARRGLVRFRTTYPQRAVHVTLTAAGHRLLNRREQGAKTGQRFYHGFGNMRDMRHDAALYPLYQQEVARIEKAGGRIRRVVLDAEFRQSINRRLAQLKELPDREQVLQKMKIAQEHGLTMVKGKIPLPDLRLEYEGPEQQLAKVDLELVTTHYHHRDLALKVQAGFAIHAFPEEAARLRPVMQGPEVMQEILSL